MRIQAKTLIGAAALVIAGVASATDIPQNWAGPASVQNTPPLTRAEVAADLALWQRAGLLEYGERESSDLSDAQYQQRLAVYQQLRNGPAYQAEVERQGGTARSTLAGRGAAQTLE